MAQHHNRYSRIWNAMPLMSLRETKSRSNLTTPAVTAQTLPSNTPGQQIAVSQSVSQSVEKPPSPKRLHLSDTVAAGFSLRVHASWVVPILLVLLLTFFTNTDVMGKSTPLRSPLMVDGEGEGVIASEAKAVLALSEAKKSPLPSPSTSSRMTGSWTGR